MREVAYYPSRSGSMLGHTIYQHENGSLSCNCPTSLGQYKCWALKKEEGKAAIAKILGKSYQPVKTTKSFNDLVPSTLHLSTGKPEPLSLELLKANHQRSLDLHAVSYQYGQERKMRAYYMRFK